MVRLHEFKKRFKKVKYIEYDIDELNHIIYNNLEIPLVKEETKNQWFAEKMLYKGETAKLIKSGSTGYHYITDWGRVLNAKQVKELRIQDIRGRHFAFYIDGGRRLLEEIMEEEGFIYDYDKIKSKYKELNIETRWVKG